MVPLIVLKLIHPKDLIKEITFASKFETTLFADDTNLHLCVYVVNTLQAKIDNEI